MDQSLEEWRPVVGYEGLYEVSSNGRVKSLKRTCPTKGGARRTVNERIMMASPDGNGYMSVPLSKDSKHKLCEFVTWLHWPFSVHDLKVLLSLMAQMASKTIQLAISPTRRKQATVQTSLGMTLTAVVSVIQNRLSEQQIRFARKAVRRGHATSADLACAWRVHCDTVHKAVSGINWSWLDA